MESESLNLYECALMDRDVDEPQLDPPSNILDKFPYLQYDGLIQRAKDGLSSSQSMMKKSNNADTTSRESLSSEYSSPTGSNMSLIDVLSNSKFINHNGTKDQNFDNKSNESTVTEESPISKENIKEKSRLSQTSGRVSFILKGKLGHDMDSIMKSVKEIMIEPVDIEESFCPDLVHSYSTLIKTENCFISDEANCKSHNKGNEQTSVQCLGYSLPPKSSTEGCNMIVSESSVEKTAAYMEPSIADIRAGFLGSTTSSLSKFNPTNLTSNIDDNDEDCNFVKLEIPSDEENDISDGGSAVSKESYHSESWYTSSFIDNNGTPTVKKGGRSDPDNPFAMTSPSFSESAAKALMTTTQSSNATIVMVSIMSIGSRAKLIPNVVNSKAAQGGLVSVVNPILAPDTKETQTEPEVNFTQTSILSKLKRDSNAPKDEETQIDRLDINVRIEDDQYTGHGENKRWLCRLCPKSYTTKHNLVAHILDHSDIKPHLCLVCGKYFKQLSHLNTHMLTHDNIKPHVCTICGKGFTQISHLKRHETVHMGSKPYICDICNRGFAYPSELRLHKDKHICGTEKCMECNEEFESWDKLQEHLATSQHCNNLQCKRCDRFFKFPSLLRDHMLTHAGSRPFICTECGMDFMKEHHLRSHQFTHTGLKPFSCPLCTRSFNQKANMQRHMLIHNAKRAYRCNVCSKTFTQPQTLKAHMVVHSDTKPYKCDLCGKQFGRQHNLQGHMHMHSDSKPYSCSMCSSAFTLKGNLNRHKKVKHGLDESTELMEEDAVKFLSFMSDRGRDANLSDDEIDLDSTDKLSSSNRKSRKTTQKKQAKKSINNEVNNESDEDNEQMISYSDEERENERTQSNRISKKIISDNTHLVEKQTEDSQLSAKETKVGHVKNEMSATTETRSLRKRKKKDYGNDFVDCDAEKRSMKTHKYH